MSERIYLNNDWFFNDTFSDEMLKEDYNFSNNASVRIPHTVKETPLHYFDEHEYQKEAAYFKDLYVPAEWKDKDIFLTFDGVLHSCKVFLNLTEAGSHECGYTAFTIKLNDFVKYGENKQTDLVAGIKEIVRLRIM